MEPPDIVIGLLAATIVWTIVVAVRRLWFHPLSHVPGDLRAALTSLFGFYHNVIRRSRYPYIICDMHETYGSQSFYKQRNKTNSTLRSRRTHRPKRSQHQRSRSLHSTLEHPNPERSNILRHRSGQSPNTNNRRTPAQTAPRTYHRRTNRATTSCREDVA